MATTVRYRKSTSEVIKINPAGQVFDVDEYWGMLTDPALPDGNQCIDENGDLRVLGVAKFAVVGTNTVRNATAGEITTFIDGEEDDLAAQAATEALRLCETDARFRKVVKAIIKRVIAENNLQAAQWNAFRAQVAAATTLADLKTRVANNTTDMPTRTNAQGYAALAGDISVDD